MVASGALVFFLFGLPAAVICERLIAGLSAPPDSDGGEPGAFRPPLPPWQRGPWPDRVRRLSAASAPCLLAAAGWRFDFWQAAAVSALLLALLLCTATDLLRFRVPNAVTYPGILLALLAALVLPGGNLADAALAAALAGASFLVLAVVTRGGIGLGDAKLAALIGAALGASGALQALFLGVVIGGVVVLVLLLAGKVDRRQTLPYAPFLALAAVVVTLSSGASFAPL